MSQSPLARAWGRFKKNRRAWVSLWLFAVLFGVSLFAEVLSNDKPLVVRYHGEWYVPVLKDYNETAFGGDFDTPADYLDPYIRDRLAEPGNWALFAPNPYSANTINEFTRSPNPAQPSSANLLGTDDRGRDILARLVYGFRLSVLFALALTVVGTLVGIVMGALQGYFGGRVDLTLQRASEIWGSLPELYLLIILSSFFNPSLGLLLALLALFGWMGLADYVRAEFLKNRQMEYALAARALGVSNPRIIWRHLLPNSLTPVLAFLPFRVSGAILALTSLDFLGLGVPASTPSLGELLSQGKDNLDAWWIALSTFTVLTATLLLLIFIGEGLRSALDTRKG
ncbi:ABC transporter permease [Crenobacter cavernae]|uniref:ABC transporter permease n=1 Tax=Crenobacter cavernae TaxID=2290923 RepID=A0A345Y9C7_9NEIS|nr:ABC transporter permease [Crenobacter cavernae]AXK40529.1 ABC transporter permease [Crenobacter cavernae]